MTAPQLPAAEPPRLLRRLLASLLRRADEQALDTLDELYDHHARRDGISAARRWYLRQSVMFPLQLLWHRTVSSAPAGYTSEARGAAELPPPLQSTLRRAFGDSVRALRRAPAFSALVILTLALGIGANTTMLAVLDELVLRPPRHVVLPGELYSPSLTIRRSDNVEYTNTFHSYPVFKALQADSAAFAGVAMYADADLSLGTGTDAQPVRGMTVSGNYFKVFGTQPIAGRFFAPEDDAPPSGNAVAVVSERFWRTMTGSAPDIVGRKVTLDNSIFTVIGVAPVGFAGTRTDRADVWLPVNAARSGEGWRRGFGAIWLQVVARLRPGVSPEQGASLATQAVRAAYPPGDAAATSAAVALRSILPSRAPELSSEGRLAVLLSAVSLFVLLTACANVANLTLARNTRREGELMVRMVLGIGQLRLALTLILETLILAVIGGGVALATMRLGGPILIRLLTQDPDATLTLDWRRVAIVSTVVLLAALVTGLVPALGATRRDFGASVRSAGRGTTTGTRGARRLLLALQCASCVALLCGSGLFALSLRRVAELRLGFDFNTVWTGRVNLPKAGLDSSRMVALQRNLLGQARLLPGITAATLASVTPMSGWGYSQSVTRPGHDSLGRFPDGGPYYTAVADNYFATMGTRIMRGRPIDATDGAGGARVVVINEATAAKWFPGEEALGQCLVIGKKGLACTTIVGISEDVRRQALVEKGGSSMLYLPIEQYPNDFANASLVVRATGAINPTATLRRMLQGAAPNLPYAQVSSLRSTVDSYTSSWRMGGSVLTAFGILALLLAAIGIYGVFSFVVVQRLREIGIRMALGARGGRVLRMVLGEGMAVALSGAAVGLLAVVASGPLVRPLLFRVSAVDPVVLGGAVGVVVAVAAAACFVPALRATRVEPMSVIRAE